MASSSVWSATDKVSTAIDIDNGISNPLLAGELRDSTEHPLDCVEEKTSTCARLAVGAASLLMGIMCGILLTMIIDRSFGLLGLKLPCGNLMDAASRGLHRVVSSWQGQYKDAYARELQLRGIAVNSVADTRQPLPELDDNFNQDPKAAAALSAKRWTDAHNHFRNQHMNASHNLVWDSDLAKEAQAWADTLKQENKCEARYSLRDGYGENMYWGAYGAGQPPFLPWEVVSAWAGQKEFYDYEANTCKPGMECSSYLQVVWKQTTKFGCGEASCEYNGVFKGSQTVLLCYYHIGAPFNAPHASLRPY